MLERIVSGGQTGVDRAALDVALELALPCGGFCPKGRIAEDGPIDARYPLVETPSADYAERTLGNVRDSDATLILNRGALQGGSARTARFAEELGRPLRIVDLDGPEAPGAVAAWAAANGVRTLNVAGPRESGRPGIYASARLFLRALLSADRGERS